MTLFLVTPTQIFKDTSGAPRMIVFDVQPYFNWKQTNKQTPLNLLPDLIPAFQVWVSNELPLSKLIDWNLAKLSFGWESYALSATGNLREGQSFSWESRVLSATGNLGVGWLVGWSKFWLRIPCFLRYKKFRVQLSLSWESRVLSATGNLRVGLSFGWSRALSVAGNLGVGLSFV